MGASANTTRLKGTASGRWSSSGSSGWPCIRFWPVCGRNDIFNLDQAISEWRQQMAAGDIKAPDVLNELESHLRDEVDEQVRSRMSVQQALEAATYHIGQATVLRAEFEKADQAKRLRVRKNLLRVFGVTIGVFITGRGTTARLRGDPHAVRRR